MALLLLGFAAQSEFVQQQAVASSCEVKEGVLVGYLGDGTEIWRQPFPEVGWHRYTAESIDDYCRVTDVDGDGRPDVLFHLIQEDRLSRSGALLRLDPATGGVRWRFSFGSGLSEAQLGADTQPVFSGRHVRVAQTQSGPRIVATAVHQPRAIAELVVLDPETGVLLDRYLHPGHFYTMTLADLTRDGFHELLLGGVNNPGDGVGAPIVVALDLSSSVEHADDRDYYSRLNPQVIDYFVLPRDPLADRDGLLAMVDEIGVNSEGRFAARVTRGNLGVIFQFKLNERGTGPEITDLIWSDPLRESLIGLGLPHSIDEYGINRLAYTPDGNDREQHRPETMSR